MRNTVLLIAAVAMLAATGWVHGSWTNRWRPAPELADLAARLQTLPETIGDWKLELVREIAPKELAMAGAVGYVSRVYSSASKSQNVSILVLTGLPGDIATHTPDICYPGAGFVLGNSDSYSRTYGRPERTASFQTATASRGGADPAFLRLFWSWYTPKGWSAPDAPRWAFAAESALTKLYVQRDTKGVVGDPKEDPCQEFLALLLPELDRVLAAPSKPTEAASVETAN
jgi:hypothetical protein